jgi:hypothetical protein
MTWIQTLIDTFGSAAFIFGVCMLIAWLRR